MQRLASADARSLGVINDFITVAGAAGADVAIVRSDVGVGTSTLTLTQLPLEGGTPRDLLKGVRSATWDSSGAQFAIVRAVEGRVRLEYPVGKVVREASGIEQINFPRISPDGARIAYFIGQAGVGNLCVADRSGRSRTLSEGWRSVDKAAWSPDGTEIWFSATRVGVRLGLHAVTLSGKERLIARFPGNSVLQDIAPDGRVLVTFGQTQRHELRGRMAGDTAERHLSWLDGTSYPILAPDGTQMVFQEHGEGGGLDRSVYHWRMDGSAPTRLGEGTPCSVSPDWTAVLVLVGHGDHLELRLVPIGAGETRTLACGPIHLYEWAFWHPDGKRILIEGYDAEGQRQRFVQDIASGPPRLCAPAGAFAEWYPDVFSPDGRYIGVRPKDDTPAVLFPIDGGEARPIPFLKAADLPLRLSDDGKSIFLPDLTHPGRFPVRVLRLDLETGRREQWLELAPPDRAGVRMPGELQVMPNGRFYAYGYDRRLSDLYLIEGLQ